MIPPPMSRRRIALYMAIILAAAVVTRAMVFRGYAASDDANYAIAAWQLARGTFPPTAPEIPPHYHTRLGLLVPVAVLFRLFGVSEATLVLMPILFSGGMLALAYLAGRTFFSPRAGLAAMALYAVMPVDARFATWLLTDTPAALWSAAGVFLLFIGSRDARTKRKVLLGLTAAACFGASWLTRTQVAQMVPFVIGALIVWCVRDRRNLWLAATCAAGAVGVFLAEGLVYLVVYGDFLHRLHVVENLYAADPNWYFREGSPYGWQKGHYAWGLVRRLFKAGPAAIFLNPGLGLAPLAALIAILHVVRFRGRGFLFPASWFLYAAAVFNFGSASLRRYEPLPWSDAYLVPVLFPAVVVVGGWLSGVAFSTTDDAARGEERRFWAALVCAMLALGCAYGLFRHARQGIGCPGLRSTARALKPDDIVYTDPNSLRALEFFRKFPATARVYEYTAIPAENLPVGSLVVANSHELERLHDLEGYEPPDYVRTPPPTWRLEWESGPIRIYRVCQGETSPPSPVPEAKQ